MKEKEYFDSKMFDWTVRALKIHAVTKHAFLSLLLREVKSGSGEISMENVVYAADQLEVRRGFLGWIRRHTPYEISGRKVINAGKCWSIEGALNTPYACDPEDFHNEAERFQRYKNRPVDIPLDLEGFVDYLQTELERIVGLVKNRAEYLKKNGGVDKDHELKEEEKKIIRDFLNRNPAPESTGPMGKPKGKYRYDTYGKSSMEIDVWRGSRLK